MTERLKVIIYVAGIVFFITLVVMASFTRYFVLKDYQLVTFTECNTDTHSCFTNDPNFDGFSFYSVPYAKVNIYAPDAPACLDEHTCQGFSCDNRGEDCLVIYCSEDNLDEGEICTESS